MVSVVIPFKNDWEIIDSVVDHLLDTGGDNDFEIIVVNDGSVFGSGQFRSLIIDKPRVSVVNIRQSWGVGASFDRGVEACKGDIVILQGSDVFPKEKWFEQVVDAVNSKPETLGCSVCIGLNPERMNLDNPKNFRRYGSDLLFTVDNDDLPKDSALRQRAGGYTSLFHAKWLPGKQSDEPYPIPCVLGAFYFCTKEYYVKMGGWDTAPNNRYIGHRSWGTLEPYISLKSWLIGGGCTLYPNIEAGHVFSRIDIYHQFSKGARSAEWVWWNRIFLAETTIFNITLRQKLYRFVHPELNFGVAQKMIKDNYSQVEKIKKRNMAMFTKDAEWFINKFNIRVL